MLYFGNLTYLITDELLEAFNLYNFDSQEFTDFLGDIKLVKEFLGISADNDNKAPDAENKPTITKTDDGIPKQLNGEAAAAAAENLKDLADKIEEIPEKTEEKTPEAQATPGKPEEQDTPEKQESTPENPSTPEKPEGEEKTPEAQNTPEKSEEPKNDSATNTASEALPD